MKDNFGKSALSMIIVMLLLTATLAIVSMVSVDAANQTQGDFTYTVSDGKATLTGYTGSGGAITVPSTLGGDPTVGIGLSAFRGLRSPPWSSLTASPPSAPTLSTGAWL